MTLLNLALVAALLASPQGDGAIRGIVRDSSGGVMPGVTVTATVNGRSVAVVSNGRGEYAFAKLERGTYKVTGTLAGFHAVSCDVVEVGAAPAHCDLVLSFGGPPIPQSDPRYQALLAAEARWRAAGLRSYAYSVSVTCFCGFDSTPFTIRVVDGVPAPLLGPDTLRNKAGERYNTIEKLFTLIRSALDNGSEVVDVSYDPDTGKPVVAWIDRFRQGSDDEIGFSLFGFAVIKTE